MDSEEAAQLTAINRYKKPMVFGQKKRIIDVIQCSGEDMNLVLTSGISSAMPTAFPIASAPMNPMALQRPIMSPNPLHNMGKFLCIKIFVLR